MDNHCSSELQKQDILITRNPPSSTKIPRYIKNGDSVLGKRSYSSCLSIDENNREESDMEESSYYDANFDFENENSANQCVSNPSDQSEINSKLSFLNEDMSFEDDQNLLERYPGIKLFMLTGIPRSVYGYNIPEMYLLQKKYVLAELKSKLDSMQLEILPSFATEQQLDESEDSKEDIYMEEEEVYEASTYLDGILSHNQNYSTDIKLFMLTGIQRSAYGYKIPEIYLRQKKMMLEELKRKLALMQGNISPSFIIDQLDESEKSMEDIYMVEYKLSEASIFSREPNYSIEIGKNETKLIFGPKIRCKDNQLLRRPNSKYKTMIDSSTNKIGIHKDIFKKGFQNDDLNHRKILMQILTKLCLRLVILGILMTAFIIISMQK